MAEGMGPGPEEMGLGPKDMGVDESQRVQNPEVAHEMAKAEAPMREKIQSGKELGVGEDVLRKLGLEANRRAEEKRRDYEWAMKTADDFIATNLKYPNVGSSEDVAGDPVMSDEARRKSEALDSALAFRLMKVVDGEDGQKRLEPKIPELTYSKIVQKNENGTRIIRTRFMIQNNIPKS